MAALSDGSLESGCSGRDSGREPYTGRVGHRTRSDLAHRVLPRGLATFRKSDLDRCTARRSELLHREEFEGCRASLLDVRPVLVVVARRVPAIADQVTVVHANTIAMKGCRASEDQMTVRGVVAAITIPIRFVAARRAPVGHDSDR